MSGFTSSTQFGGRGRWRGRGRGRGRGGGHESPERPPKTSECATDKPAKTLRHSLTHGSSELCELYVGGPCSCSRLHHQKRAPYVWQYESLPDRWSFLSNEQTELVEQAFCNNEDETVVEIKRFGCIKETTVTFDGILDPPTRNSVNKFSFQRLSTRSYAEAGSDAISLYTQWVWYWKDNDAKWHPFLPPELQLTLETKYLAGQDTYLYTIGDQEYRLDFTSLVQVNRKYQTRRLVNRRPMFV
ncbi:protein mono-ADP-ribosyltransferase PARP12-like [Haliotis rufescens]|uniref:protein mono-ADP-ribosyltransferase PARP12-like n=1 Tax=Haliotis rufescens TaxID=6454 RepID=UPI00201EA2C5|nr:protein mono-ADP-ribosyltransferase PARP12-like [Haliotis rufescens]